MTMINMKRETVTASIYVHNKMIEEAKKNGAETSLLYTLGCLKMLDMRDSGYDIRIQLDGSLKDMEDTEIDS